LLSLMIMALAAPAAHSADHAVILQYHFFGEEHPVSTTVTLNRFRQHLEIIRDSGCHVLPLSRIIDHLREGRELPDMCVAISIDDAYRSVFNRALPVLEEFGYPATLFIPTGAVDNRLGGYMSWDQIREAKERGIEPASHGHSHKHLIRLRNESVKDWEKRVKQDILLSVERLEEELDGRIELFAYPYGEYCTRLKEIVGEMGLTAFGQHSGAVGRGSDFLALPRFPVSGPYSDLKSYRIKISSLPLPVESASPENPLIGPDVDAPLLRLDLGGGDYLQSTIACFVSGQGEAEIRWLDSDNGILEVKADNPVPIGRSRYNFTARHREMNRFYWYSHPWIKTDWIPE